MSTLRLITEDQEYLQLFAAIDENPRALEILFSKTHALLIREGGSTFFVFHTLESNFIALKVNDPEAIEVTWEDETLAIGTPLVVHALEFLEGLLEMYPEDLSEEYLDVLVSLRLLIEVQTTPKQKRKFKRIKPLFEDRKDYLQ